MSVEFEDAIKRRDWRSMVSLLSDDAGLLRYQLPSPSPPLLHALLTAGIPANKLRECLRMYPGKEMAGIRQCDSAGRPPLGLAVSCAGALRDDEAGKVFVECLVDGGAEPLARSTDGRKWTALNFAIHFGLPGTVAALLPHSDVDLVDTNGWSPLHQAAFLGKADLVQLLCDAGASCRRKNNDGRNPEKLAREGGHSQLATLLRDRKRAEKRAAGVTSDREKVETAARRAGGSLILGVKSAVGYSKERAARARASGSANDAPLQLTRSTPIVKNTSAEPSPAAPQPTTAVPASATAGGPAKLSPLIYSVLVDVQLTRLADSFVDNEIDPEAFLLLTDADLRDVGVTALGPRKKLLAAIAELQGRREAWLASSPAVAADVPPPAALGGTRVAESYTNVPLGPGVVAGRQLPAKPGPISTAAAYGAMPSSGAPSVSLPGVQVTPVTSPAYGGVPAPAAAPPAKSSAAAAAYAALPAHYQRSPAAEQPPPIPPSLDDEPAAPPVPPALGDDDDESSSLEEVDMPRDVALPTATAQYAGVSLCAPPALRLP